jgi:mono/diheme cytochrome c family protein
MTGHRRWVAMSAGAVLAFGRLLATMPESDPDTLERGRYLATAGRGGPFSGPRLAGSAVVQAPDPASLLNIILYGPDPPAALQGAGPHWETMRPYKQVLSDEQIAAVSNFVRNSWGNRGDAVTPAEVARQRE